MTNRCYYCGNEITDANYQSIRTFNQSHRKKQFHNGRCVSDYLWYGWPKKTLRKNGVL